MHTGPVGFCGENSTPRSAANAAMRSIVRRDTGESYQEYLTELAKASGIKTPTREALARLDRRRKRKDQRDEEVALKESLTSKSKAAAGSEAATG